MDSRSGFRKWGSIASTPCYWLAEHPGIPRLVLKFGFEACSKQNANRQRHGSPLGEQPADD